MAKKILKKAQYGTSVPDPRSIRKVNIKSASESTNVNTPGSKAIITKNTPMGGEKEPRSNSVGKKGGTIKKRK
jgi:hypothetical protein